MYTSVNCAMARTEKLFVGSVLIKSRIYNDNNCATGNFFLGSKKKKKKMFKDEYVYTGI